MREILFRGKRKDNGKWIEGFYFEKQDPFTQDGKPTRYCISDLPPFGKEIISETVGQFTGLPDKNGKKIFEGDIVKTKYGRLCIVVWLSSPAHCGWDLNPIGSAENCIYTKAPDRSDLYKSCNLEVIGNIHDNPELLGGAGNG